MKNILIISPLNLPIPAVMGGAVESLLDNLITTNEVHKKLKITIISIYHESALNISKTLQNTEFLYLRKKRIIEIMDKIVNKLLGIFIKSRKNKDSNFLWKLITLKKVKRILSKNDYDSVIIENQGYLTNLYKSKTIIKKYHNKIYFHLHNIISKNININLLRNEKILVVSDYLKRDIGKKYGEIIEDNCYLLKNGIDTTKFHKTMTETEKIQLREKYHFHRKDFVICFIGRIVPEKGIMELLKAFQNIEDQNCKLLIIGSTEFAKSKLPIFEKNIIQIVEGNNRIERTGFIVNDDIWKYHQISDVAVFPSTTEEAAGLTIIEALCSGLPVITTNAGGIPEYMNQQYGIILNNDESLVQNLIKSILMMKDQIESYRQNKKQCMNFINMHYDKEIFYKTFLTILESSDNHEKNKSI